MRTTNPQVELILIAALGLMVYARPVFADESVQDLKKQIKDLEVKVAALEAHQKPIVQQGWQAPFRVESSSEWDPFRDMERMHNDMGQMVRHAFGEPFNAHHGMFSDQLFFDSSGIQETKDGYVIKLDVTGFDNNKINVSAKGNSLAISGEYKNDEKQNASNRGFESHDYGQFLNTMPLPSDADVSKIKTENKGDQLEIFIPKKK